MTELTIDRPIEGDIQTRDVTRVAQKSATEFLTLVDSILSINGVLALRWTQHTPYFNDGEPCEFGGYLGGVKLTDRFLTFEEIAERDNGYDVGDYEDGFLDTYSLYTSNSKYAYDDPRYRTFIRNGQDTTDLYDKLKEFELDLPRYYDVLLTNFGDPATVTATSEGFEVEYYEHD